MQTPHSETVSPGAGSDTLAVPVAGRVVSLHLTAAAAQPMRAVAEARAVPGRGLEGDRYWAAVGTYSGKDGQKDGPDRNLTLLETEALDALARDYRIVLHPNEARRNVVTRGAALNHYVGRVFRIGAVTVRGIRLCDPCRHLERLTGKLAYEGLIHRGGLRCEILTAGTLRVGDRLEE